MSCSFTLRLRNMTTVLMTSWKCEMVIQRAVLYWAVSAATKSQMMSKAAPTSYGWSLYLMVLWTKLGLRLISLKVTLLNCILSTLPTFVTFWPWTLLVMQRLTNAPGLIKVTVSSAVSTPWAAITAPATLVTSSPRTAEAAQVIPITCSCKTYSNVLKTMQNTLVISTNLTFKQKS